MLAMLRTYSPEDPREREMLARMIEFAGQHENCCERSLQIGHMTGSAWVVDHEREHALLTHHRKLNRWMQVGGHADGNPSLPGSCHARSKRRIRPHRPECPFEHALRHRYPRDPPHADEEPRHLHYDVRFLLEARCEEPLTVSEESHARSRGVPLAELAARTDLGRILEANGPKICVHQRLSAANEFSPP